MNASAFQENVNRSACMLDAEMRTICGVGRVVLTPAQIAAELLKCKTLLATSGKGSGTTTPEGLAKLKACEEFIKAQPGPAQTALSFATKEINNISDLLNFCKASAVLLIGASLYPALIVPTNIIVFASFVYAIRNQIKKFTLKLSIQ